MSRRNIGNLDGNAPGVNKSDLARVQINTNEPLTPSGSTNNPSQISLSVDVRMQNIGLGAGPFVRKEPNGQTFSFRRILGGEGISVLEQHDTILISAPQSVTRFINLLDVPSNLTGQHGKALVVDELNSRLVFDDITDHSFLDMSDTPESFFGQDGKFLKVNAAQECIEFVDAPGVQDFLSLVDTPNTFVGSDDRLLVVKEDQVAFSDLAYSSLKAYDYGHYFEGKPSAGATLYRWRSPRSHKLNDNFSGCLFSCDVNPLQDFVCRLFVAGIQVGRWTIEPSGKSTLECLVEGPIKILAGQEVRLIGPDSVDLSIENLLISFMGELI
jgi:hypothetical protein